MIYEVERKTNSSLLEGHLNLGGENAKTEIQVTNRYLKKNGVPWIPIMGEMHYVRVPEEYWEEEMQKMRAGGITAVSTYVIWIYHEQKEGQFCFEGRRNLRKFVETAEKCGLSVVLRIGPWVHGEVRNGGFPDWLINKGIPLRQNQPEYLMYVRRFYQRIYDQVKDYLFYKNGPIWAIQLENELTDQADHLYTLRLLAEETGLRVPIYTVTGWNAKYGAQIPEYDVLPVFGGYPEAPWENHKKKLSPNLHYFFLPERNDSGIGNDLLPQKSEKDNVFQMNYDLYPFATCELGGGIPVTYHRRPNLGDDDISSLAMVKLGCGNNMPGYYMYKGGINDITDITLQESKETGYPNDYPIRNYDFQAPLGAYGEIRESWRKLKLMHLFLKSFGSLLAPMEAQFQKEFITDRNDKIKLRYNIRTDGKSGFIFVNNYQRLENLPEHLNVQFKVPSADGEIVLPEHGIKIPAGSYFFFPYYLYVENILIKYATAQLLCRIDHTLFFFAIRGVTAEYCIRKKEQSEEIIKISKKDQIIRIQDTQGEILNIITLSQEEAEHFFSTGNKAYITEQADIYEKDGRMIARSESSHKIFCKIWNGEGFVRKDFEIPEYKTVPIDVREIEKGKKEKTKMRMMCEKELWFGGKKEVRGWEIELLDSGDKQELFLEIEYTGDVLQIYSGNILVTDEFYRGVPFRAAVKELTKYGRKLEIWISELREGDCYLETGIKKGLELRKISLFPIYNIELEEE